MVKSINNCYQPAWDHRGQIVHSWGKDSTGLIDYRFNNQGYRHCQDYNWPADWAFFGNSIVFGIGVHEPYILTSQFECSQNYGLSGNYMNHHSVTNLKNFTESKCYIPTTRVVFFWIDRDQEDVNELIQQVKILVPGCLNISSGQQRPGAINLMPQCDQDVSGTHPGPKTHKMWANTIKLLSHAQTVNCN